MLTYSVEVIDDLFLYFSKHSNSWSIFKQMFSNYRLCDHSSMVAYGLCMSLPMPAGFGNAVMPAVEYCLPVQSGL